MSAVFLGTIFEKVKLFREESFFKNTKYISNTCFGTN